MRVQRIQNNNTNFTSSSSTLRNEIAKLKNPTKEIVEDLYGNFGLDIYAGKKHLTILSDSELNESKNIISKMKNWLFGSKLQDFEEGDTLTDVLNKFINNKNNGLVKDIEKMFGKKGMAKLEDEDVYIYTYTFNSTKKFIRI